MKKYSEQWMIDRGLISTREDSFIRAQRQNWAEMHHYRYGDRKDAAIMALKTAEAELRRAVRGVLDGSSGEGL